MWGQCRNNALVCSKISGYSTNNNQVKMQFIAVYVVLSNNLRDRLYGYIMVA